MKNMKDKIPYTLGEKQVMDYLVNAHNVFSLLEQSHPSEMTEWVTALHQLQGLLMQRITRRDYPEYFPSH